MRGLRTLCACRRSLWAPRLTLINYKVDNILTIKTRLIVFVYTYSIYTGWFKSLGTYSNRTNKLRNQIHRVRSHSSHNIITAFIFLYAFSTTIYYHLSSIIIKISPCLIIYQS